MTWLINYIRNGFNKFYFNFPKNSLIMMAVFVVCLLANVILVNLIPHPYDPAGNAVQHANGNYLKFLIIYACFVAPILEELIFRKFLMFIFGLVLNYFKHSLFTFWTPILLSAILFAAAHRTATGFPFLFVLGMGMGYTYKKTGTILNSMLFHASNNVIAIMSLLS